ncbi:hypothetical protein AG1IA_09235 [Rhizoctonia solani AG-1 IA]|uniref:Uncharacterized protein n=1 Tax=Thanatephorus cucumeris (strain AG1-IA) TaxID=983506 RepID=L8WJ15_THACA|nr:hypothetical protein AG1IA_09235 [Rhizoctonia solani AG-1 IA]
MALSAANYFLPLSLLTAGLLNSDSTIALKGMELRTLAPSSNVVISDLPTRRILIFSRYSEWTPSTLTNIPPRLSNLLTRNSPHEMEAAHTASLHECAKKIKTNKSYTPSTIRSYHY